MTPEAWRVIPSHPRYEASDLGRIRNARTGHVLRPQWNTRGYLKVHLGRGTQALVQRLVCEAFHGPPELDTHHADHLDFNRTNNRPDNLRWLPAALNIGRQVRYGPRGWEVTEDEEPPEDHVPLSEAERAALDEQVTSQGWWLVPQTDP